jgi:dTDP-glucose pyrophosphorylase
LDWSLSGGSLAPRPQLIVAAAGAGSRFAEAGFDVSKPRIQLLGRPLLWWSMLGLTSLAAGCDVRLITRSDVMDRRFVRDVFSSLDLAEPDVVFLDERTRGQAETVLRGSMDKDGSEPLVIWNVDTAIGPHQVDFHAGNHVHCFDSTNPGMSFVLTSGDNGDVQEVVEKVPISKWASSGLYFFESVDRFRNAYEWAYAKLDTGRRGEEYVAPLYQELINRGRRVTASLNPTETVVPLGTPDDLAGALRVDWIIHHERYL